jgi:glc operon protein GlcG
MTSTRNPGPLDRALALSVAEVALGAAESAERRITVAIVDERGHDLLVLRGDGAGWFTAGIARAKAATAAAMGVPSASLASWREDYPELIGLVGGQMAQELTTLPGGLPLQRGGRVLGAIGVSGASPAEDVAFAEAGAAAWAEAVLAAG